MSEDRDALQLIEDHDDGREWGWMGNLDGSWRKIPKVPLLLGGFGPPPFTVTLPDGSRRAIVHRP